MKFSLIGKSPKDASAIIIYKEKKILLNLRSNKKNIFYPNHWGLLGGANEKNESLRLTAIREFKEETSLKIIKKNLIFFNSINFSFHNQPKKIIKRNFYTYEIKNLSQFNKNFKLTEGIKCRFYTYKQVKKLKNIVPYDKFALDIFFDSKFNS